MPIFQFYVHGENISKICWLFYSVTRAWRDGMGLFLVWEYLYFISTHVSKQLSLFEKIMSVKRAWLECNLEWQSFYFDFTCVIKQFNVFYDFLLRMTRPNEPWWGFCRVWCKKMSYVEALWVWGCLLLI